MSRVGLQPDPRRPGFVRVTLDGVRVGVVPEEQLGELGVRDGQEIGDLTLERVRAALDAEGAYQRAVRLLAARPRASVELLRRLTRAGHNPSAAAHAVGRLESLGLLDDAEFARHFARIRFARGHGPGRILADLLSRGVERRQAELAIADAESAEGVDVAGQAEVLARKRAAQLGGLDARAKVRRIVGFLARRGFTGGEVVGMVRRVVRGS